jgi:hypothetical protein
MPQQKLQKTSNTMATLDEILNGGSPNGRGRAPKGSQEWAEQNSGENAGGNGGSTLPKGSQEWAEQNSGESAPVSSSPTGPTQSGATSKPSSEAGAPASGGRNEKLFKQHNPYTPPTAEELEKERKKQKREQIIAAIGDGLTALSNLYFTSQYAPNMYSADNSLSEKTKKRYEKIRENREVRQAAYLNGLAQAMKEDEKAADNERRWQRQLGLDQEARDRYNSEQAYRRERDEETDRRWQANFDEGKRRSDLQVQQHKENIDVRRELARATAARAVRGKQLGFSDGKGNQVAIYENVWKGSMQQVYDAMLSDLAPADEAERKRWERQMKKLDTPQKKEDYVKQNWHKSPKASQIMLTLSGIDPATMTSELNDDVEDYSQYEQLDDEDFSQYEVK